MILSPPAPSQATTALRFDYETARAESLLHRDDVLAVFGFGAACPLPADARVLRVGLEPVGAAPLEVWRTSGPVRHGCEGDLRWSEDGDHLFFALEVDEQAHGGIEAAAEHAYRRVMARAGAGNKPHFLRLWNYLDAINAGDGDAERYRLFCQGRARGMRVGGQQLLISGTAAVVGHASCHDGDAGAQLDETLANLHSLLRQAGLANPTLGAGSLLKIYLRDAALAASVEARLRARIASVPRMLMLAGDICRRELLLEIDGEHRAD